MENFFKKALDFDKSVFVGATSGIWATMKGVAGDGFDYGDSGREFTNAGKDVVNGFTGQTGDPPTLSEQQQTASNIANDPTTAWNSQNWKSYGSASNANSFGAQTPNAGLVPPSQLMKISDPTVKINVATTASNPNAQTNLNNSGAIMNASMAPQLAAAI